MKQDIRKLFKDEDIITTKLPTNHRKEFIQKLEKSSKKPQHKKLKTLQIAVSILFLISISGYWFVNQNNLFKPKKPTAIELQVQQIEAKYLQEIHTEWSQFTNTVKDKKLIKKYKERLSNLSEKYKEIHDQFKENPNSISVLEALINNLQTRVQLLKDIQEQLQLLQQKPTSYETIIL